MQGDAHSMKDLLDSIKKDKKSELRLIRRHGENKKEPLLADLSLRESEQEESKEVYSRLGG